MSGFAKETYHITLELGHKAEVKPHIWDNPSHIVVEQEPTHQWECWVNAKVGDMSKYVDKVVFNLHETFPKPKRVVNAAEDGKYLISEQGYAGFEIFLDIYFKGLSSNDPARKVKIKYDLFLTPSMEVLYADPKRTTVKKTQEFFRLERITISHADPKFLKLLELGGAQKESGMASSSSKDKVPSSGTSKSSGGGYYTPEFKSGKKDSNAEKSSSKPDRDRGYTTSSHSSNSKSSGYSSKDRHRNNSSSNRVSSSERGSYRSRSRERNDRSEDKKSHRDSDRNGSKDRDRYDKESKHLTSVAKHHSGSRSSSNQRSSSSKGSKDDGHYNTSIKYTKSTGVSGSKESLKETSPCKEKTANDKNTSKASEPKQNASPLLSKSSERPSNISTHSAQPKNATIPLNNKPNKNYTSKDKIGIPDKPSRSSPFKEQKERTKEIKGSKTLFDDSPAQKNSIKKESSSNIKLERPSSAPRSIINNQKDLSSNMSTIQIKAEKSEKHEKNDKNMKSDERKSSSRPGTPSTSLSSTGKLKIDSTARSERKTSPSNFSHKPKYSASTESELSKDSKVSISNSSLAHINSKNSVKSEDNKNSSTKKEPSPVNKSKEQVRDKERRKDRGKEKEKQKSEEKPKQSKSAKCSPEPSLKKIDRDANVSKGDKVKIEKKIQINKEPEVKPYDKVKEDKKKTNSNIKPKPIETEKKHFRDITLKDNSQREQAKRISGDTDSKNCEKEREKDKKEKELTNMSGIASRETSKKKMIKIYKEEKVIENVERSTLEQTRKTVDQREGSEKKEKESKAAAKFPEQNAKGQFPEECSGTKVLPTVKTKEKNVPKNMSLHCLIKAKKPPSRPKLYESSDDNLNAVQEKESKELAKELSISSDDDNTTGNTERDTNIKKDADIIVDSQTSENGSKKNRSSRKDKNKKKSKKREKETLGEETDVSNKSKKKKRKEKEKKGRKKHKSVEDTKPNSNSVENEKNKHTNRSIPLITEECPLLTTATSKILKHHGTKTNVFTSDGSDSDRPSHSHIEQKMEIEQRSRGHDRILADISRPPEPVSPLSSSSSISSPVRGRRYKQSSRSSSQNSSSSSSPRSVIKTPSPLPTTHARHISTSSDEDEATEANAHKRTSNVTKVKNPLQKVKKAHITQKSPYISDSDSDVDMTAENKPPTPIPSKPTKELETNKTKKRPTKKDIRPRSLSSSSKSPSPNRPPINVSPNKAKHKKGRKNASIKASPAQEKQRSKNKYSSNSDINEPCQFPSASLILHAPTPVSPLPESPPSSPGSNSFDKHNYKREDKTNNKYSEEKQDHFLQPSSPSRLSKRSRFPKHKKSIDEVDSNITPPENVQAELKEENHGNSNEKDHAIVNDLESLLNDDNYYPVQENHKEFIPITKLKDPVYVEFLQVIQDRISNPQPGDNLHEIAELIQETGCFDVKNDEFIFDLGLIEKATIKKIVKALKLI